jgi:tetratricopeptide (TPR) repeat protein
MNHLVFLLFYALLAQADDPKPAVGWFVIPAPGVSIARPAVDKAQEEFSTLPLRWMVRDELNRTLKAQDRKQGILDEAGRLFKDGRELHMGLKLWEAAELYRQAIEKLEQGFVRYYDPGRLAEPVLQLGVAFLQLNQKDKARKSFMRAAALAPALQLSEGYYSPSVRKAFLQAKEELGVLRPGIPPPKELARMCVAAELSGMIVVSLESLGDRPLLRTALFDAERSRFVAVETAVLEESTAAESGAEVAARLKDDLAAVIGFTLEAEPPPPAPDAGVEQPQAEEAPPKAPDAGIAEEPRAVTAEPPREAPDAGIPFDHETPPPPTPWYVKHWWIWAVSAAVIGTAVALPLTVFREDVVDVRIRY